MARIIAEACCNHLGSRDIMESMIRTAAGVRIDVIKFQSFKADKLRKDYPDYADNYTYYKKNELSEDDHIWLMEKCKKYGIEFLTTVFNLDTVDFLASLGLKRIKIGSADCNNWDLIDKCLSKFDELIISTGLHTWAEIRALEEHLECSRFTLMHCVSLYPIAPEQVNMQRFVQLNKGWPAGFSDHTVGLDASKLAISLGAKYVERHYTLSRYLPGKDQPISSTPEEFAELVRWRDQVNLMNSATRISSEELTNREKYIGRFGGDKNVGACQV
jgi:N,N'-diacetyllegionaminate synthase